MYCYLIRHGQDDESVRGGWSLHSLTKTGHQQARELAKIFCAKKLNIMNIYSSDLPRAMETAEPIAKALGLSVQAVPAFREADNGKLAGMKHEMAEQLYPGVYWNTLAWEQSCAGGESPKEFFQRITDAWSDFTREIEKSDENVVLVTHGGVIQVILSLVHNVPYTNRKVFRKVKNMEVVVLNFENGVWREK